MSPGRLAIARIASTDTACVECVTEACRVQKLEARQQVIHDRHLARGDHLGCAGEGACLKLWTVVKGTAAVCTTFEDGRRQIISLEPVGSVLCAGLSGPGSETWLEALTECHICEADLSADGARLRTDAAFLTMMFSLVHRRLARSQAQMATLGRLDSRERVLLFLAELARQTDGPVTHLPMSREDIADYLGLNAETVSRVLTQIRKSGLVKFLNRTDYVIPDMAAVRHRLPLDIPGDDLKDEGGLP